MSERLMAAIAFAPVTPALQGLVARAGTYAADQGHRTVKLEHLLLALTEDGDAVHLLETCGVDVARLRTEIAQYLDHHDDRDPSGETYDPPAHPEVLRAIQHAAAAARGRPVGPPVVLAAIVGEGSTTAASLMSVQGFSFQAAVVALQQIAARARAQASPPPPQAQPVQPQPMMAPPSHQPAAPAPEPAKPMQRPVLQPVPPARPMPPPSPSGPARPPLIAVPPHGERTEPPHLPASPTPGFPSAAAPARQPAVHPNLHPQSLHPHQPMPPVQVMPMARPAPPPAPIQAVAGGQQPQSTPPARASFNHGQPGDYMQPPAARPERSSSQRALPQIVARAGAMQLQQGRQNDIGRMVENIPRRAVVGQARTVEVRVRRSDIASFSPAQTQRMSPDGRVMHAVCLRLRAPEGGFGIELLTPETAWLDANAGGLADEYATWRWRLVPNARGRRKLVLGVTVRRIGEEGLTAEMTLPEQTFEVAVAANVSRIAIWAASLAAALATGVLAGLFGNSIVSVTLAAIARLGSG